MITRKLIQKSNKNPKAYAASLKSSFKREKNQINIDSTQQISSLSPKRNEYRRNTTPRRSPPKRYQQLFLGYCFSCHNFGNKSLDCKAYKNTYHKSVQKYGHRNNKSSRNQRSRNYNSFSQLLNYNIKCYKCNNYGHKASNYKLLESTVKTNTSNFLKEKHKNIWKEKQKET
jgi:hypothetical protein